MGVDWGAPPVRCRVPVMWHDTPRLRAWDSCFNADCQIPVLHLLTSVWVLRRDHHSKTFGSDILCGVQITVTNSPQRYSHVRSEASSLSFRAPQAMWPTEADTSITARSQHIPNGLVLYRRLNSPEYHQRRSWLAVSRHALEAINLPMRSPS